MEQIQIVLNKQRALNEFYLEGYLEESAYLQAYKQTEISLAACLHSLKTTRP